MRRGVWVAPGECGVGGGMKSDLNGPEWSAAFVLTYYAATGKLNGSAYEGIITVYCVQNRKPSNSTQESYCVLSSAYRHELQVLSLDS
jgi:hypothetical protein